jgi:hypothetical protein
MNTTQPIKAADQIEELVRISGGTVSFNGLSSASIDLPDGSFVTIWKRSKNWREVNAATIARIAAGGTGNLRPTK